MTPVTGFQKVAEVETTLQRFLAIEGDLYGQAERLARDFGEINVSILPCIARFLKLVVLSHGFKKVLEVGTFTGYSTSVMALAIPEGGRIESIESNEIYASVATRFLSENGVWDRVNLIHKDALETLEKRRTIASTLPLSMRIKIRWHSIFSNVKG